MRPVFSLHLLPQLKRIPFSPSQAVVYLPSCMSNQSSPLKLWPPRENVACSGEEFAGLNKASVFLDVLFSGRLEYADDSRAIQQNKTRNGHLHFRDLALGVVFLIPVSQRTLPVNWMVSLRECWPEAKWSSVSCKICIPNQKLYQSTVKTSQWFCLSYFVT